MAGLAPAVDCVGRAVADGIAECRRNGDLECQSLRRPTAPPAPFVWSSPRSRAVSPGCALPFLTGVIITAPFSITIYLVWQFLTFLDTRVEGLLPERSTIPKAICLSACRASASS